MPVSDTETEVHSLEAVSASARNATNGFGCVRFTKRHATIWPSGTLRKQFAPCGNMTPFANNMVVSPLTFADSVKAEIDAVQGSCMSPKENDEMHTSDTETEDDSMEEICASAGNTTNEVGPRTFADSIKAEIDVEIGRPDNNIDTDSVHGICTSAGNGGDGIGRPLSARRVDSLSEKIYEKAHDALKETQIDSESDGEDSFRWLLAGAPAWLQRMQQFTVIDQNDI